MNFWDSLIRPGFGEQTFYETNEDRKCYELYVKNSECQSRLSRIYCQTEGLYEIIDDNMEDVAEDPGGDQ